VAAGTMTIRPHPRDGSDDDVRQLAGWLRDEEELRGRVTLAQSPVRPGEMGGVTDAVVVAMTSGTAGVVVTSLFTWLSRRREAERVSVTVESGTGEKAVITCGSADDAARLLQVCHDTLGDRDDPATT
jgi:hypothetical protein